MRISELSTRTDVPVATIKYYIREGLIPEGTRSARTQATYADAHVRRLKTIRALIESGLTIAQTRRVLGTLDDPPGNPHDLLGAAHAALTPRLEPTDLTEARALVAQWGWAPEMCDDNALAGVARALDGVSRAGFAVPEDVLPVYLDAVMTMARAEIAAVPTDSVEASVRYVVLGTVLAEPLLLALRRVAEQIASAERFGAPGR